MAHTQKKGGVDDLSGAAADLLRGAVALRNKGQAAMARKERRSIGEGELRAIRDEIECDRAKLDELLNLIKRTLEAECIEIRVALGGTRYE